MLNCDLIKAIIPNSISLARIFLSIFFVICVFHNLICVSFVIFIIAAISDFLDGYLARRWKVESYIGSMLDPLADKCLMISSYLVLTYQNFIPIYLTVVVIFRDIAILFVVVLCKIYEIPLKIEPIYSSKVNTTIQLLYIILVLACRCSMIDVPSIILCGCALVVMASTAYSAVEYARKYYWIKNAIHSHKQ